MGKEIMDERGRREGMRIYFAPMEGITDAIFRQAYQACFGGVDKYFMPFVSPSPSLSYTGREEYDIAPEQNRGLHAVPQILARDAVCFLGAAGDFREMGYTEVNLNLGCPSGTVTGKGKGAAMLRDVVELQRFLDQVYANVSMPVSIKTRIGFDDPGEWERLLPVFARYPVHELILHPRTRQELYRGMPHREAVSAALNYLKCPVIYNGDLFTARDVTELQREFPGLSGVMLGRGLLANPALFREMNGGPALETEDMARFHDYLFRAYMKRWRPVTVVGRMHIFLKYFAHCLDVPGKLLRDALKENKQEEYLEAAGRLFRQARLKEDPRYTQPS